MQESSRISVPSLVAIIAYVNVNEDPDVLKQNLSIIVLKWFWIL